MIYLVSKQAELFKSKEYCKLSPEEAIAKLQKEPILGADTETEGLDPYSKKILTIQLGTEDFQIVWDCLSYDIQLLKPILESDDILLIWWNACFDLKFLYHKRIIPKRIYDGMLAEKLLWLGYPAGSHSMSLKEAGKTYCNVELDKSVRGKIVNVGITPEVIVYAAFDVKYEIPIYKAQLEKLKEQDLIKAAEFENEFVKVLAYIEYCGVRLDVERWEQKVNNDKERTQLAEKVLNDWVVNYYIDNLLINPSDPNGYYVAVKTLENHKGKEIPEPKPDWKKVHCETTFEGMINTYRVPFKYVFKDPQGNLWSGFEDKPHCTLNWSSSKQLIPFFELLGFKLETFDKATKQKKKSVEAKIIESQLDVSTIAPLYIAYKKAEKVSTTYGQNFLAAVNPISGRIHASFSQLMDTGRLSCGGGLAKVNVQNLPSDAETRACFVAEKGNRWISADYQGQESRIIASISNDEAMIDLFLNGCGDVHSLTAKMAYPNEIGDCPVEDIKKFHHHWRQEAKGIEFAINYGGDFNTIASNKGIPLSEAKIIYDNYMKGFPGVKSYQDYCRKEVMDKGYILLNPITKHKAYIFDFDELRIIHEKFKDPEFWNYYKELKKYDLESETVKAVRYYMKRKSACEKQSINYRVQNRGAMAFKLASIKLFNYLRKNNLLFIVKYCVPVHDELNLEAPEDISEEISKVLVKCMEEGAKPFCPKIPLGADVTVADHWIH